MSLQYQMRKLTTNRTRMVIALASDEKGVLISSAFLPEGMAFGTAPRSAIKVINDRITAAQEGAEALADSAGRRSRLS